MLNTQHCKGSSRYDHKNQWQHPIIKGSKFFQKYHHKEIKQQGNNEPFPMGKMAIKVECSPIKMIK